MTKEEYQEQLRDNRWSVKRKKILARDLYRCKKCKATTNLEVHHLYYVKDHKAWEYPNNALITWCNECHGKWHDTHEIVVRKKSFTKGKKKQYTPPTKQPHSKKNRKLRSQVNKYIIPKEEFKIIWWEIRRLSDVEKVEYIKKVEERYKKKK